MLNIIRQICWTIEEFYNGLPSYGKVLVFIILIILLTISS